MWTPRDAQEIEKAAMAGTLEETSSFDAKADLPTSKKNIDIAIDIAAMSTDGGSILYGVGEDEQERLTVLNPIELTGVTERIDQVVSASIAEVPYIEIRSHPLGDDSSKGYVSVLVPQSARAPHQVIVGDDKRFYGRNAKGNRRLGEGDIARLYQRRLEWDQDEDALLDDAIGQARFPVHTELAYLHAFARPVAPDRQTWKRAVAALDGLLELQQDLRNAAARADLQKAASSRLAPNWRRQSADEWLFSTLPDADPASDPDQAEQAVDMRVNADGRGYLLFGRAGAMRNSGTIAVIEPAIAGKFASFVALVGRLYDLGGYRGQVDVGLAVTNIGGASTSRSSLLGATTYRADSYRSAERFPASRLLEPRAVATEMLQDFFEAITNQDDYDAFGQ
jgi:hypothetical protein